MTTLQEYISKRIRILRLQQGLTQEQLEAKANLGTNYAYKLENLSPNIKVKTLDKIMEALEVDIATFFDITSKEEDEELVMLVNSIKELPKYKQQRIISAINTIIQETK